MNAASSAGGPMLVTVEEYAKVLKIPPELLVQQLISAGIACEGLTHLVTDEQKQKLLEKLKKDHGDAGVTQFTVMREMVSELNKAGKKIKVVTKKRRKFIKR